MTRRAKLLLMFSIAAMAIMFVSCKPITYYLEQVDKAYGRVTDGVTGLPLESVEVSIHGYQYSELTNSLGDYELMLADGTWTLDFVKDGYTTSSKVVTVGPRAQRAKADAQLTPVAPPLLPPDFVGTWKTTSPDLLTVTFTETTFKIDIGGGESLWGTITSDTAAKTILATVENSDPPETPPLAGTKLYFLYSVSGTTLYLSLGQPDKGYPTDLSSAYVYTKQ
jgi:Carboxypeptidase regulatory-like domain